MIITLLINLIVIILGTIFSWLPVVTTLPNIAGYDIDSALVSGVGQLYNFMNTFWPIKIMFQGFLFLLLYYISKFILRFFIGHRSIQ